MKFSAVIPGLVGGQRIPVMEQWLMLDELYKLTAISVGTIAILITCIIGMVRSPSVLFSLWASSAVTVVVARAALVSNYRKRAPDASIARWTQYFFVASAFTGLQWSVGAIAFYYNVDWATRMSVYAIECGLITGASGRSYTAPGAAMIQIGLVCLGFFLVFVVCHEWLMAGISAIYFFFNVSTIRRLGATTVKRIQAECGRRELVDMLAKSNEQLGELNARLESMAFTDSLTGLANRRGFDAFLKEASLNAALRHQPLALLIADVDHFKRFNDAYGHPAGDACLASVGTVLATSLDLGRDFAARYGGEEFAIVLPDTSLADAVQVANRIRLAVSTITLSALVSEDIKITISVGGASIKSGDLVQFESLVKAADEALYRAKSDGRDCVRFSNPIHLTGDRAADDPGDVLATLQSPSR